MVSRFLYLSHSSSDNLLLSSMEWKLGWLISFWKRINYFGRQLWRDSKLWAAYCWNFFLFKLLIFFLLHIYRFWPIFMSIDWCGKFGFFCFAPFNFFLSKKIVNGQKDIFTEIVLMTFHGTDSLNRFRLLKIFFLKECHSKYIAWASKKVGSK